jgi:hypothetical protein
MHKRLLFLLIGISSLNFAYSQCLEPNMLELVDATNTTASISWVSNDTEAQWSVEYGIQGFTPGNGTTVVIDNVQTADINGLTTNSIYDVYVRAICGLGDTSAYSEPISFNTYNMGEYIEADNICGPTFMDISTTGTNLELSDDETVGMELPFPFYYQGDIVTEITISNNGGIALNDQDAYISYAMENEQGIYPYIQDLYQGLPNGGVFSTTTGTAPNRKFIIQWNDVPHYPSNSTDGANFEVVIDEATQEFFFLYDDVQMSNPDWDNGGDAEIGIRGDHDINISLNNSNYLQNNSCAHFYYTDCPKPMDFEAASANITSDEIGFSWSAGQSGEGDWVVIWGEHGFDPTTGTPIPMTTTEMTVTDLDYLTTYDFYIYAQCDAETRSNPLIGTVQTLPLCANPTDIEATADQDSLYPTWDWVSGSGPDATAFNIQYGPQGYTLYNGGSTETADNNLTDTIHNTNLMAGAYYDVYVQAVCGSDTSLYQGPFTIAMPLSNNDVCAAEPLIADGRIYSLTNTGASLATGENAITPPLTGYNQSTGWSSSDLNGSTWFTFVAPASGNMRINTTLTFAYNKIAIYSATNCGDFGTFVFAAGNENYPGSNFVACGLTPGATYYLMYANAYNYQPGNYQIKLSEVDPNAGTWNGLESVCIGDTIDLNDEIAGFDAGGQWSPEFTNIDLINGSLLPTDGLASMIFDFEYRVSEGCAFDTVVARVKVFGASSAGDNGTLTVCKNQPFNLLAALTGSIDLNGTWLDPANMPMASGQVTGANFQGSYNYDYIAGNNVCPNDTSLVVVTVLNCDYLGMEEAEIAGFNLYPNPTDGLVYISHEASNEVYTYEVTDMNGRVIATQTHTTDGSAAEVDLRTAQTGMYLVRVFNANAEKTFRVVVK